MRILSILVTLFLAGVALSHGQNADGGKRTDFVIKDGGLTRQFELALDETDEKQPDGKSLPVKAAKGAGLGEMRQKALAKEKENGRRQDLVLYEKGKPRSEATRRVETRKVLVKVAEGFDADVAAVKFGAASVERPSYAPGHVIFTFKEPGESLTKADEIKKHAGVLSAGPMLAKQQRRR
jgi:hypothetical protein